MAQTKTQGLDPIKTLQGENAALKKEMAQVKTLMAQMAQHLSAQGLLTPQEVRDEIPLEEQPWFIKPGSDRHASLLGLDADSESESGWRLSDPSIWGSAASQEFLRLILGQKINELEAGAPQMQSVSPQAPNYAVPMWVPTDDQ